jgi:L-threonylcarbamoyladenylate synthase
MTPPDITGAVELLRAGALVAFPTETVYGLGANALDAAAVRKVFALKGRPAHHPLIVHLGENPVLESWAAEVPRAARILAAAFWPGPLTLILKRASRVPAIVTGGQDTVGLRVPNHPIALELLARFAGGIAAPSANRYGRISPTTAAHVRAEFGARAPLIIDGGPCAVGIESTIIDLSRGRPILLRPGAISASRIAEVIEVNPELGPQGDPTTPRVSGSLPAHYAPHTPLRLVAGDVLGAEVAESLARGLRVAVLAAEARRILDRRVCWACAANDAPTYARDLYARLRELDASGSAVILVETPPRDEAWLAINDRLRRAAQERTRERGRCGLAPPPVRGVPTGHEDGAN